MDEPVDGSPDVVEKAVRGLNEARLSVQSLQNSLAKPKKTVEKLAQIHARLDDALNLFDPDAGIPAIGVGLTDLRLAQAKVQSQDLHIQLSEAAEIQRGLVAENQRLNTEVADLQASLSASDHDSNDFWEKYQVAKKQAEAVDQARARLEEAAEQLHAQLAISETLSSQRELALAETQAEIDRLRQTISDEQRERAHQISSWQSLELDLRQQLADAQTFLATGAAEHQAELARVCSARDKMEGERDTFFNERNALEDKLRRESLEVKLRVATELGALLVNLSVMAGQEPSQVDGLSHRSLFEQLKRLMRELAEDQPLQPFPLATQNSITLSLKSATLETLLAHYNWEPDLPFASGAAEVTFRLVTRGWLAGDRVLARAQLALLPDEPELVKKDQLNE